MKVEIPRVNSGAATERASKPTASSLLLARIYSMFVEEGKSEREIALALNQRGIISDFGGPWTRASIHQILTNEKYIGNNIFTHVSSRVIFAGARVARLPILYASGTNTEKPAEMPLPLVCVCVCVCVCAARTSQS
jgi:hypothetical protein